MMVMMMKAMMMVTKSQYLLTAYHVPSTVLSKRFIGIIPCYLVPNPDRDTIIVLIFQIRKPRFNMTKTNIFRKKQSMELDIAPWVTNKRSQCHVGINTLKNILMMNLIELNSIRKSIKLLQWYLYIQVKFLVGVL